MRNYVFMSLFVLGLLFFLLSVVNDFLYKFTDRNAIYFVSIFVAMFFPVAMRVAKQKVGK